MMENCREELVYRLIDLAFAEDIGDGDHTTLCCIPADATGKMRLLVKEDGVLAGVAAAEMIFHRFDPELAVDVIIGDGSDVGAGDTAFTVEGRVRSLMQTERTVLNVMQRMSGIATVTRHYVRMTEGTGARILDTRKTTPGMRILEKEAVRIGGAVNHRTGLFDMILLKDNHIDFAGGITAAIAGAREYLSRHGLSLPVEIEVRNFAELGEVIAAGGVDRIMLDNFSAEDTRKAAGIVAGRFEIESSGGITDSNIKDYAGTGVDYISVGALTHSVKSLDMSLKYVK
jgi:nicotinate-nucleotide pyrophosphorylase (carboxylating)